MRQGALRKCMNCGAYTLNKTECPHCHGPVRTPHPPKFSPEDRMGKYRRLARKLALQKGQADQSKSSS